MLLLCGVLVSSMVAFYPYHTFLKCLSSTQKIKVVLYLTLMNAFGTVTVEAKPRKKVAMPAIPQGILLNQPIIQTRPELQFMGLFTARGVQSNVTATGLLDDQLVGRLYGDNGSTSSQKSFYYLEQRALAFFDYQPLSVNGKARLQSAFEIDFTYGDSANAAGSNAGGAINGDQVNLQTKRLLLEVDLLSNLQLVIGLQPLTDSAYQPTRADPHDLLSGGGRLLFWGTDASGVSLYGQWGEHRSRLAFFHLNLNEAAQEDDIWLTMLDQEFRLHSEFTLGFHLWHLQDQSGAKAGGVDSNISTYTGATSLYLGPDQADASLTWLGVDGSFNRGRRSQSLSFDFGLFMNVGTFSVLPGECRDGMDDIRCPREQNGEVLEFDGQDADLLAFLVDVQLAYRWGRGNWDLIALQALYATGDNHPDDKTLSSVVTGNSFGTPGALFAHHRSLLLFPDPRSINRHVGVVYDPGNLGYGLQAITLSFSGDVLSETLNLKGGLAYAGAAAEPLDSKTRAIGREINMELTYRFAPFLWFGVHAAVVQLGRFLESTERVPVNALPESNQPWMTALSVTWIQL